VKKGRIGKKIGITQRVVWIPERNEIRDCLDQAWTRLLAECGYDMLPIPNALDDPAAYLAHMKIDGLILSGGNDVASTDGGDSAPGRDHMEKKLIAACGKNRIPVLGVCRGMQMLNLFHGGRIRLLDGHAGTVHQLIPGKGDLGFSRPTACRSVSSHHRYGMLPEDIAPSLYITVWCEDGSAEGFVHTQFPHFGIMWHPERSSPFQKEDMDFIRQVFVRK